MKLREKILAILVAALCLFSATPCFATNAADLAIGIKILPLLTNKPTSAVHIAVIFDPLNNVSATDTQNIRASMDHDLEMPGGGKFIYETIPITELHRLSNFQIAFLAKGMSMSAYGAIATAASKFGVLTISTDLDCVRNNKCVLGIVSIPTVEIYFSKSAADSSKVSFSAAFLMLVKQI
jgi:hypothetical protein